MSDNRISETLPFLAFTVGDEPFMTDISGVREIVKQARITEVPGMPDYLPGVLNLRGEILSVIDLRALLQPNVVGKTAGDYVIVAEAEGEKGGFRVAMIVDAVSEVMRADAEQLSRPPDIGMSIPSEFIRGIVTLNEAYMILLDIKAVVAYVIEKQVGMADTMSAGIRAS